MQKPVEPIFGIKEGFLFHFCQESKENDQNLALLEKQVQCTFLLQGQIVSLEGQIVPNITRHTLQIKDSWVIEVAEGSNQPLSKFRCDCFKTFEVIRRKQETNGHQLVAVGIILSFLKHNNKCITLLVQQQDKQKLQQFWKILQCKYIIQKGFYETFKPSRRLGKGLASTVILCYNNVDRRHYAVKCYNKNGKSNYEKGQQKIVREVVMQKEFRIWRSLSHKSLLPLNTVYETDNTIYMITEQLYITLHTFITKHGFVKKTKIKQLLLDILSGINYLHQKGIMHRDIKLDNIMLKKNDLNQGKLTPVIIDFGLAEIQHEKPYFYLKCGTPGFTAPQILSITSRQTAHQYDKKCDMFSFGVVAYILMYKKMPFKGETVEEVVQKNKNCQIIFPREIQQSLGPLSIDFLSKLLQKDPTKRITSQEALSHPFLQEQIHHQKQKKWGSTNIELPDK